MRKRSTPIKSSAASDVYKRQLLPREVMEIFPRTIPVGEEYGTVIVRLEGVSDREWEVTCLLYTSPSPRDMRRSRMPSSA